VEPSRKPAVDTNLLWAVAILTIASGLTALATAWICEQVLAAFRDSHAFAALLTNDAVILDDKNTEGQLRMSTAALKVVRDLATCLAIGCAGVGVALGVRVFGRSDGEDAS